MEMRFGVWQTDKTSDRNRQMRVTIARVVAVRCGGAWGGREAARGRPPACCSGLEKKDGCARFARATVCLRERERERESEREREREKR